jgi:hypothetical protein
MIGVFTSSLLNISRCRFEISEDEVGAELRHHHPESFRPVKVSCRNGEFCGAIC